MKAIVLALCTVVFCLNLEAAVSEKKYEKTFSKEGIEELVISNRYGRIEVEQTDGTEISIAVNMAVTAKTDSKSDEILEVISVKETQSGNSLDLETVFGKDMALKQLLSGITLSIDYKISMPKGIKLRLINVDGNVFLSDFTGELNADIRDGNFKAASLKGEDSFYIKQNKGNIDIDDVESMDGDFKSCIIKIESAQNIKMVAGDCEGHLNSVEKLNIRTSGGTMKLGQIEDMSGSSSMTKYEIQDVGNILTMDMKMGEINVRNIHFNFSEVNIKGSFTKVGLTFMEDAGYKLELKHNKSLKMDLPRGMQLEERPTSEKNMVIGTKFIGNIKYSGKVVLNLSNGNLYIQ